MEIRVGLRMRLVGLGKMVTIVHCHETRNPITKETHNMCLVRTDEGQDYYATDSDLEEVVEQATLQMESEDCSGATSGQS